MPEKAKVAVFVSGKGTNMAALLYASRLTGSAYEIVLVAANDTEAEALTLAKAEGIETFALSHKGMTRSDHDAAMESAAIKSTLAECMQLLDRRESHIVDAYFGMTCHPKTLEEIGGEIGLTRERVRQLRNRALKKMRDAYGDLLMQMCSN